MTKVKVITSLEASEKVVKELLCLDVGVVGVNCKGSDVGPKGNLLFIYTNQTKGLLNNAWDDFCVGLVCRNPSKHVGLIQSGHHYRM